MNIIPEVKKLTVGEGFLRVGKTIEIDYGKFDKEVAKVFLGRTKIKEGNGPKFVLALNKTLNEEAYTIDINKRGVSICASNNKGVIYAFLTIYKLLKNECLNYCQISDYPDYGYRGLNLDCSRHFYSFNEVKKIVDCLSLFKINRFHWHLSDDHGFRIESKVFKKLTGKDFYTQKEILELVQYAKERAIEVIPEIDMPGHVTAIINAYPELSCTGDKYEIPTGGGIFPALLCAGNEKVYDFIEQLLKEVSALFPYKYFHIGGDEAYKKTWESCEKCQTLMKTEHIESLNNLQGYFTNKVIEILKKIGKEPIVWNETMLATNIQTKPLFQYWTPSSSEIAKKAVDNGFKWIFSDMYDIYLDYPYSMSNLRKVLKSKAHIGISHNTTGLVGYECCLWSEHIKTNDRVEELIFPRVIALAEGAWSGMRNYRKFCEKLDGESDLISRTGIKMCEKNKWTPHGKVRHDETINYLITMKSGTDKNSQKIAQNSFSLRNALLFIQKFLKINDIKDALKVLNEK